MNILLPIDDSPESAVAVQVISTRPWPTGSNVRVLSVVENAGLLPVGEFMIAAPNDLAELAQQRIAQSERLTDEIAASLEPTGLSVQKAVREGNASEAIIEEAKDWPADLIVMGTHGYTGLKKLVLGSVAHSVVNHAPCSVEVVRDRLATNNKKTENQIPGSAEELYARK